MTISALITMVLVQVLVSLITGYFFLKVLKSPPKPEEDSYTEE